MEGKLESGYDTFCIGWDGLHLFPPPKDREVVLQHAADICERVCPGYNAKLKFKEHDTMIRDVHGKDMFPLKISEDFNPDLVNDDDEEYAFQKAAADFDAKIKPVFDSFARLTPDNLNAPHQVLSYSELTRWKGHDTYTTRTYDKKNKIWVYNERNFLDRWLKRYKKPLVYDKFTFLACFTPQGLDLVETATQGTSRPLSCTTFVVHL
eukprot:5781832-Prymnesium_polylepis.1